MIFSYNSSSKGFLTKTIKANVEEFTSTFFFFLKERGFDFIAFLDCFPVCDSWVCALTFTLFFSSCSRHKLLFL